MKTKKDIVAAIIFAVGLALTSAQTYATTEFASLKADVTCTNDNFDKAYDFGDGEVSFGYNVDATSEEGEPLLARWPDATTTVWWKWTATKKCKAIFSTIGSDFDTVMDVYSGDSLATLKRVVEDDDGANTNLASKSEFTATAGTTYYIAVSGRNGATGTIVLNKNIEFVPTFSYRVLPDDHYLAGGAMITGADEVPAKLEIPQEIDGYTVVAIETNAFIWSQNLEEVTLPDTMIDIGKWAFGLCYELRKVSIPNSVTRLGSYAFYQCFSLEDVTIGSGIDLIDKWTFGQCFSMTNLKIASGVETIGQYAFSQCYLETVVLPSSVTNILWGAFANNPALTTAYFPSSLKGYTSNGIFENTERVTVLYYNCKTPVPPQAVSYIEASEDQEGVIEVTWAMDDEVEVSGYKLYRAMRPHFRFATLIAELGASENGASESYFDYDVSAQYTYCYWVVPVNDIFVGEISDVANGYCEDPFQIVTSSLSSGTELEQYEQALSVNSGNIEALKWYADGLPPGLTISGNGIVSGIPTQYGTYAVTIGCRDVDYTICAEKEFTIEISENANRKPQIGEVSPAGGTYQLLKPGDIQTFSITAFDPDNRDITYTWIVDGNEIMSGSSASYTMSTDGETPGTRHDVICYVNDDLWENVVSVKWTVYLPRTLYVDANSGNYSTDGLTAETALASLQSAINRSMDGDTIIVADGIYEPIETTNRKIVIKSMHGYKNAIIDGGNTNNCALLGGPETFTPNEPPGYGSLWQGTNTVLRGFTLRNGRATWGAGVTAGTVENCLIVGNTVEASPVHSASPNGLGGGAYLSVLRKCTITGNVSIPAVTEDGETKYGGVGGGSSGCILYNCIEWNNTDNPGECGSDGGDWWRESVYENCFLQDPLFVNSASEDYRLFSTSPCIINGTVAYGCESEVVKPGEYGMPEISNDEASSWVVRDLAVQYAEPGESAYSYISRFANEFGSDASAALSMPTGKNDAFGNTMYVWQDYVAGTDPLNTNSVFKAKIEMVDGAPTVTWDPKLNEAEEVKRRYTVYGKSSLDSDEEWHSPTNVYDRFFKVVVEMK